MTATMQKEVNRIQRIIEDLEGQREDLVALPVDAITEEEEDRIFAEITAKIDTAISAKWDAQISKIRPNDWTKSFLESFEECQSKKITSKQAGIFERCLHFSEQKNSFSSFHGKSFTVGSSYAGIYNGMVYKVSIYSGGGYLYKYPLYTI